MEGEFFLADKPAGILTHSDGSSSGFVEHLQQIHNIPFKVVHRLDKDTSGSMLFGTSESGTAALAQAFEKREVEKTYLFITDRSIDKTSFVSDTTIKGDVAKTHFQHLESEGDYSLWQAQPETGRTHQIRIHASLAGIPILGDAQYEGSKFARVMLHSLEIKIPRYEITHRCEPPVLFKDLTLLSNPLFAQWLTHIDRRARLFHDALSSKTESLRLIDDKEDSGYSCDKYGEHLWFYRFRKDATCPEENKAMELLTRYCKSTQWTCRQMENRGVSPALSQQAKETQWVAQENGTKYVIANGRGWSPGLFLDQRENREWVKHHSRNLSVLNLFCYTGGFSVCAALGGAKEVISVDTSSTTLEWARENFTANNLSPENYEFWSADARSFLSGCLRRERRFDLIICDPPSFARNKKGTFRLEKEAQELIRTMLETLTPGGRLLFSCNLEKWSSRDLKKHIKSWAPRARVESAPGKGLDFTGANSMKSFLLTV